MKDDTYMVLSGVEADTNEMYDFKEWLKDNKGRLFWKEIRNLLHNRLSDLKNTSLEGMRVDEYHMQRDICAGQIKVLEHILELPEEIDSDIDYIRDEKPQGVDKDNAI